MITTNKEPPAQRRHYSPTVIQPRNGGMVAAYLDPTQTPDGIATFHLADLTRVGGAGPSGEGWAVSNAQFPCAPLRPGEPPQALFPSMEEACRALEAAFFARNTNEETNK